MRQFAYSKPPPIPPTPFPPVRPGRPRNGGENGVKWGVAIVIGIAAICLLSVSHDQNKSPSKGSPQVSVGANSSVFQLTNRDTNSDWQEAIVYLNDRPPFTYKWEGAAPARGESIKIPLSEFTKDDGERFDGLRKKVTQVWVGGSGYDYVGFSLR